MVKLLGIVFLIIGIVILVNTIGSSDKLTSPNVNVGDRLDTGSSMVVGVLIGSLLVIFGIVHTFFSSPFSTKYG